MSVERIEWVKAKNGKRAAKKWNGSRLIAVFFYSQNCPDDKHYNVYFYEADLLLRFRKEAWALDFLNAQFSVNESANSRQIDDKPSRTEQILKEPEIYAFEQQVRGALLAAVEY